MPSFDVLSEVPKNVVVSLCRKDSGTCRFHGTRARKNHEGLGPDGKPIDGKPTAVCMRGNPILAEQAMKFQSNTREGCTGAPNYQPITGGAA